MTAAGPGQSFKISPSIIVKVSATPQARASFACSFKCRASPCIGTTIFGLSHAYISLSSSRRGCPVTCTNASASVTISTPSRASPFCTRATAFSLPGIVRDEKMTRSPLSSEMSGCSSAAIRAMAARTSPWLPVHMTTTLSRGRSENRCWSRYGKCFGKYPVSLATSMMRWSARPATTSVPAGRFGRRRDRCKASNIRGKASHRDAARRTGDDLGQRLSNVSLGRRASLAHRIRRVTDNRKHTFVAKSLEPFLVRRAATTELDRASSRRYEIRDRPACGWRVHLAPELNASSG